MKKKGQVQTLAPTMIALVFASVLLVFGLIMTQEMRDTDIVNQAVTASVNNETVTTLSEVAQNVTNVGNRGANSFAVVSVTNTTGGVVASGNYTFSSSGALASTAGAEYNGSDVNISYTYLRGGESWVSANDTIAGLGSFADFWEIIVLAIIISIVIGLLLVVFAGRRNR